MLSKDFLVKKIRINVTQDDIDNGQSNDSKRCPITRAMRRAGFLRVDADTDLLWFHYKGIEHSVVTPKAAKDFITHFDSIRGGPAKPVRFTITLL
jgi:hypothetical protein